MPQRTEQYGESRIGPPTYTEWLSKELGELLLSKGTWEGDATNLYADRGDLTARMNDYWNLCHKDQDTKISDLELRDKVFYEAGFTPILNIELTSRQDGSTESFPLFRPKDNKFGLGYIFIRGFTEEQKEIHDVVLALEINKQRGAHKPVRNPSVYPPLRRVQEIFLPQTIHT